MKRTALPLMLLILLAACPMAHGVTWYVPSQCLTIQAGVYHASVGDTVLVACGTYYENDIPMRSGVCLRSETGQPDCVTLDNEGTSELSVLRCTDVDSLTEIVGFTLTRGGYDTGGALYCENSSPRIFDTVFFDNQWLRWWGCLLRHGVLTHLHALHVLW